MAIFGMFTVVQGPFNSSWLEVSPSGKGLCSALLLTGHGVSLAAGREAREELPGCSSRKELPGSGSSREEQ